MSTTTATDITATLLHVWETQHGMSTTERSLGLLGAVWPELSDAQWRQVSIGDRDACLFLLQESLFGADLQTVASCPKCGERLESRFSVRDVCMPPAHLPRPREPVELAHGGYRVRFRLPCSDDLLALAAAQDARHVDGMESDSMGADSAVALLLRRCMIDARRAEVVVAPQTLPVRLQQRVTASMAEQDPLADLQMAVTCPACSHLWSATLDIAAYLWDELDDWAQDLLAEVHQLARHYAWSEHDILSLSPVRRRFYLDLVQA